MGNISEELSILSKTFPIVYIDILVVSITGDTKFESVVIFKSMTRELALAISLCSFSLDATIAQSVKSKLSFNAKGIALLGSVRTKEVSEPLGLVPVVTLIFEPILVLGGSIMGM